MKYLYIGVKNSLCGYAITELAIKKILNEDVSTILLEYKDDILSIKDEILSYGDVNSLIFDLNSFTNEDINIVKVIDSIRKSLSVDVYLYAGDYSKDTKLISYFKGLGYTKIIYSMLQSEIRDTFIEKTKEECKYIASDDFIKKHEAFRENFTKENPHIEKIMKLSETEKHTISIAVCGSLERIGTTTTCYQLAKTLNIKEDNGACIVEINKNSYVRKYISLVEEKGNYQLLDNDGASIKNISMYYEPKKINAVKKEEYKYIIYDYGNVDFDDEEIRYSSIFEKDIIIFVCGYKVNEIEKATKITTACVSEFDVTNAFYIYNFLNENQREKLINEQSPMLKDYTKFLGYTPDMFELNSENIAMFSEILEKAKEDKQKKRKNILSRIFGR